MAADNKYLPFISPRAMSVNSRRAQDYLTLFSNFGSTARAVRQQFVVCAYVMDLSFTTSAFKRTWVASLIMSTGSINGKLRAIPIAQSFWPSELNLLS